jgi:hypothetical protein
VFLQNLREDGNRPADINRLDSGTIASSRPWLDEILGFDTAECDVEEVERLRPLVYDWTARHGDVEYHKIHDAYWLLPGGEPLVGAGTTLGAVYIIRNPLDVAVSYAHHNDSSVDEAIAAMADECHLLSASDKALRIQTPQRLLSWSAHVVSWVEAKGFRCHVVRYEDMQTDPIPTFAAAAAFLGFPNDRPRIEKAVRFSAFEEVKRQEGEKGFHERPPQLGTFFRTGRSGGWRESLSDEQVARVISDHGEVMRRFGYLADDGDPR